MKSKLMNKFLRLFILFFLTNSSEAREWAFDVYLDKTKIGQHVFKLNDSQQLISQAKFNVKILFINAYDYHHKALETWQNNCLTSLESETTEDGVYTKVNGQMKTDNFLVDNGKEVQLLPTCPMTFAYWNKKIITQSKLLNPQTAEWLDTKFIRLGTESLEVKDKKVDAIHYKLNGSLNGKQKLNIELWYEIESNDWVALKSITPEGYIINYKLK